MPSLAYTPEAEVEAAKFAVPPDIHADDLIFQWLLDVETEPNHDKARALVTEYYFLDGDRSARRLDGLIQEHHPDAAARRLTLFEFASGYGCVSRHLRKMSERYELLACDIHEQAVAFLRERLGVEAVLSHSDPHAFDAGSKFDIVFALSFFSHVPDRTFGAWIEALFSMVADNGLLIFTTHGRIPHESVNRPALDPSGYFFAPVSEQKDIPTEQYGSMIVTPFFVMERIGQCSYAALALFQEAFWWSHQDLFVVRKAPTDFCPQHPDRQLEQLHVEVTRLEQQIASDQVSMQTLHDEIEAIHRSTSWRVTAPLRKLRGLFGG
jgi:hypothetical protein